MFILTWIGLDQMDWEPKRLEFGVWSDVISAAKRLVDEGCEISIAHGANPARPIVELPRWEMPAHIKFPVVDVLRPPAFPIVRA